MRKKTMILTALSIFCVLAIAGILVLAFMKAGAGGATLTDAERLTEELPAATVAEADTPISMYTNAPVTFQFAGNGYYSNVSTNGVTSVQNCTDWAVLFYSDAVHAYGGELGDVLETLSAGLMEGAAELTTCTSYGSEIAVTAAGETAVAGYDAIRFYGTVTGTKQAATETDAAGADAGSWGCHVYGYAFLFDGVPSVLAGVVAYSGQTEDMIEDCTALVDAVAATVTEKEQ